MEKVREGYARRVKTNLTSALGEFCCVGSHTLDRSFVFKLFDIFKHLRGSGRVDKIKKYRRDFPGSFYRPRPSGFAEAEG